MIKSIIFDMGGVVAIDIRPAVKKEISSAFHMNYNKVYSAMEKYIPDLQRDYIDVRDFWRYVSDDLNADIPDSILNKIYEEPYRNKARVKKSMLELIERLKKNYKIGLITNTINDHYQYALEKGWYEPFDVAIMSNVVKLRKPEKEIYNLTLEKLDVKAPEAVFIDDIEEFLAPAKELGIETIFFRSVKQLNKDLRKLSVHF